MVMTIPRDLVQRVLAFDNAIADLSWTLCKGREWS